MAESMIQGKPLFTSREGADLLKAQVLFAAQEKSAITNIQVDSREVVKGSLFVALQGEYSDGHHHLEDAINRGASGLLIKETALKQKHIPYKDEQHKNVLSQNVPPPHAPPKKREYAINEKVLEKAEKMNVQIFVVPDPLSALQDLGRTWVKKYPNLIKIAVTGSSGKTTTKELIGSIMGREYATVTGRGNLNSDIGLPLAVMDIKEKHQFGIFELGVNWRGEMDLLVSILGPQAGVITNIGTAHSGLLGGSKGIFIEKGKLLEGLKGHSIFPRPKGFAHEKEPRFSELKERCAGSLIPFGSKSTKGFRGAHSLGISGWEIDYKDEKIVFQAPGEYYLENALCAIQVAQEFGAGPKAIKEGLESFQPLAGRGQVISAGITIYEDSYNANPDSMGKMLASVGTFTTKGKLILVLGSMRELGDDTVAAHRGLGEKAVEIGAEGIFLFGEEMETTYKTITKRGYKGDLYFFTKYDELEKQLLIYINEKEFDTHDVVVLKASRAMQLERLVKVLVDDNQNKKQQTSKRQEALC